jgi:hypothetical protein
MELIYSKVQPNKLLHIVNRKEDIVEKRQDLIPNDNFLQLATFKLDSGKKFRPHKHIYRHPLSNDGCGGYKVIAQEFWLCLSGSFKSVLYDLDNTIIREIILFPGDCSITLFGGHTYEALEDDTLVYEGKTGPYEGVDKDKVFI